MPQCRARLLAGMRLLEPGLMTLIVDLYVAWLMERCALSRVKANVLDHHPVSATVLQWCP